MRVLLVKTSSMGDVIHTLPAVTDAMRQLPDLKIDWVVEENFAQIPGWHPAVCQVLPVALRRWRKAWFSSAVRAERRAFRQRLQSCDYKAVIDAQGLLKSAALITRLAFGVRHGMDWHSAREPLASLFYQRRHRISRQQHAVERSRALFAQSLGYPKPASQGDYAIASHFLATPAPSSGDLVFLHATTRAEKHWPESHWRELIDWAQGQGLQVKLPWGTGAEHQRAQRLAQGMPQASVLPPLALDEIARLLAGARAVVSVDTGLSHLAAALDRPNITLYGPTDPGLIGGYGQRQRALISKSGSLADLPCSTVIKALQDVI